MMKHSVQVKEKDFQGKTKKIPGYCPYPWFFFWKLKHKIYLCIFQNSDITFTVLLRLSNERQGTADSVTLELRLKRAGRFS